MYKNISELKPGDKFDLYGSECVIINNTYHDISYSGQETLYLFVHKDSWLLDSYGKDVKVKVLLRADQIPNGN